MILHTALKVLTLSVDSLKNWIAACVLFFAALSSASPDSVSELSLRYRMMSNDYQSSSELVDSVFANFLQTQIFWSQPLSDLAQNKEFLAQLQSFSASLNQLVGDQSSDEQKKNSLESLITILSESSSTGERISDQSLPKVYQDYLRSLMKTAKPTVGAATDETKIKIKGNEVIKTIGTYGIWGFWFVTSTWGLVSLSPTMEHFLYYPAIAMFLASGPFSISNQIWSQVFDRLEKKAELQHQTALQYMKDKIRSIKYFRKPIAKQCPLFYK